MSTNFLEKIDPTEWISQSEAARMRGITRQAVFKLVKKGRVKTVSLGGRTFVNLQDIRAFEPQEAGRRKGKSTNEPN